MGIPAPKFAAVSDKEVVNKEAYEKYCRQIAEELPEAHEEEMIDYEPGVPDLDECDR